MFEAIGKFFSSLWKSIFGEKASTDDVRLAVHIATSLALKNDSARAARISSIIKLVQGAITANQITTPAGVTVFIQEKIKSVAVTEADKVVLNDLLRSVQTAITQSFHTSGVYDSAKQFTEVNNVLGYILEITEVIK